MATSSLNLTGSDHSYVFGLYCPKMCNEANLTESNSTASEELKCDHDSVMLHYEGDLKSAVDYLSKTHTGLQIQVYFLVYDLVHITHYKSISTANPKLLQLT